MPREFVDGRYEIVAKLGAGGMGAVYRAIDRSTGKEVALKRILGDEAADNRAVVRFQSEFHATARLQHPHVVEVYEYGVVPEGPYYTMEVLDGQDLRDLDRPSPMEACRILRDVAVALSFLHSRRLLHRDLAPRNVRCTTAGHAKLIDFGLLATFGLSEEIAGTPPLIPPEMLRGLPLDHRADLYSLGGLAYWVLTGRYAYPARKIRELEGLWRTQPPAPSELADDIPPALGELVTSLLCIDPLGRPNSAAEVADRLGAIAQLDPPEVDIAGGYLASAALIGRDREMEKIRRVIGQAAQGKGGVVVVNAPSGTGKSRLLNESLFEAQLAGSTVISASSDSASHGPYGLFREIARGLLAIARDDSLEAARPHAAAIAAVIPELREPLAGEIAATKDEGITDPAEERLRGQDAINQWVLAVSKKRSLVFLVDDVQRCDEASLAVLVGLAYSVQSSPLQLIVALRSDEVARNPEVVAALIDSGSSIKLRGLTLSDTETFVAALFGDVPRVAHLAQWMHPITGGSPLHLTEVAHYLVAKEIVSYRDGIWVLPAQSVEIEIPTGLTGAMDARIALLKPEARSLAEALAIHGGQLDLSLATKLADQPDALFRLIDELMQEQVLIGSSSRFRFRHDGLREALLRGLSDTRQETLHLRVARVLTDDDTLDEDREAEAGWHFLHGGDSKRGIPLLEKAGRDFFEVQAMRDAIPPLEAAIQDYRERGETTYVYEELLAMIVMAGTISDRQIALDYMDEALVAFQRMSGITLALRLGRFVGKHVALMIGIGSSVVRWFFTPRSRRAASPLTTLSNYLLMAAHGNYVRYATNDVEGLRKSLGWLSALNAFKGLVSHAAYETQHGMLDILQGRFADGIAKFRYGVRIIRKDKLTPSTDFEKRYMEAAAHGFIFVGSVLELDPAADEALERLQELDLRYFEFATSAGVALRRRLCGEEAQALQLAHEVEVKSTQLGAGWHLEALLVTFSVFAYTLTHDILGLKRCAEELQLLKESGFLFDAQLASVRGEYHRERGELELAEEALEEALRLLDSEEVTVRQWTLTALVEVYMAQGKPTDALATIQKVMTFADNPSTTQRLPRLRVTRAWALLEAGQGELSAATKRLNAIGDEIEELNNPVLGCMYHEAHARIALLRGDTEAYKDHCSEVAHAVNPTRNPALIAISERLRDGLRRELSDHVVRENIVGKEAFAATSITEAVAAASSMTAATRSAGGIMTAMTAETADSPDRMATNLLSQCHGPAGRSERALELLVVSSSGKMGYLFVLQGGEPVLCAPAYSDPPHEIAVQVGKLLEGEQATRTALFEMNHRDWHLSTLVATIGGRERVVGAWAILAGALRYQPPDSRIVAQLARELYEAGDVSAIHTPPPARTAGDD